VYLNKEIKAMDKCKWIFDHFDDDWKVKRFKVGCTNLLTYPRLGQYCPACGKEIEVVETENDTK
jgi:hypothetical protein